MFGGLSVEGFRVEGFGGLGHKEFSGLIAHTCTVDTLAPCKMPNTW